MDNLIRNRYSDAILQEAMRRYDIASESIRPLDAFESFIYEFERDSDAFILRIGHSFRRNQALVLAELDWINYLADGGVGVSRAIPSIQGNLVESISDQQGGFFLAAAFVKAPGTPPWEIWTPNLYETYGHAIGQIHALSRQYHPNPATGRRPDWDDHIFDFVESYLPGSEFIAKQEYKELCALANTLSKDRDSYGLTHQDAHGGNFFVDETGRLTFFDFDECAYHWYVNEIAVILFYILQDADDGPACASEFMTHFLKGYLQASPLPPSWLKEIPCFLKIREIELYAAMHRDFDVNDIKNEWCARFMRGRKSRIEHGLPYVDFDFESLA